ncbi:MAG: hypothetical protein Ct9H300mP9_5310 [Candidatus Neomarinimicrobiota bacterium]|nr:MAG: hypothetical protein Ct9H300mP9_5310 [Candidatus Neomarinimicrobiota bacterium]
MQNRNIRYRSFPGTSALWVALKAAGVKAGDEVIIPAYTFIATATAVFLANAVPVFADIDLNSGNIDPAKVGLLITKRTKAIIPVHIAGNPADMRALTNISEEHEIPILKMQPRPMVRSTMEQKSVQLVWAGSSVFRRRRICPQVKAVLS